MKRFAVTAIAERLRGRTVSPPRAAGVSVVIGLTVAVASYRALRSGG